MRPHVVSQPSGTAKGAVGEANGGLEAITAFTAVEDRISGDFGGCRMQHAIKCHQAYVLCHARVAALRAQDGR